jgi:hypothetical protein
MRVPVDVRSGQSSEAAGPARGIPARPARSGDLYPRSTAAHLPAFRAGRRHARACGLALASLWWAPPSGVATGDLFFDDFSLFPPGVLTAPIGQLTPPSRNTTTCRIEACRWAPGATWIYTQDRPYAGDRINAPARNPSHNDSNHRAVVSMPGWRSTRDTSSR